MESREGDEAPFLCSPPQSMRDSSGAPWGQEREDLQCQTLSPSFFQSFLAPVCFTHWLSLRFHLKELGGKKKKNTFFFYEIGGISQRSTLALLFLLQRDEVFLGIEGGK